MVERRAAHIFMEFEFAGDFLLIVQSKSKQDVRSPLNGAEGIKNPKFVLHAALIEPLPYLTYFIFDTFQSFSLDLKHFDERKKWRELHNTSGEAQTCLQWSKIIQNLSFHCCRLSIQKLKLPETLASAMRVGHLCNILACFRSLSVVSTPFDYCFPSFVAWAGLTRQGSGQSHFRPLLNANKGPCIYPMSSCTGWLHLYNMKKCNARKDLWMLCYHQFYWISEKTQEACFVYSKHDVPCLLAAYYLVWNLLRGSHAWPLGIYC